MNAAKRLGVDPVITANEMADPDVDHLGVMAYAARLQQLAIEKMPPSPKLPRPNQLPASSMSVVPPQARPFSNDGIGDATKQSAKKFASSGPEVAAKEVIVPATVQQVTATGALSRPMLPRPAPSLADRLTVVVPTANLYTGRKVSRKCL